MQFQNNKEKVLIIDFGSQVTKLIARRVRDLGVYSEVVTSKELKNILNYDNVRGIILSGGPSTVTKKKFETVPRKIFKKKNTNPRYLLWTSINCKIIWWKNKVFKKTKRVWKSLYISKKLFHFN